MTSRIDIRKYELQWSYVQGLLEISQALQAAGLHAKPTTQGRGRVFVNPTQADMPESRFFRDFRKNPSVVIEPAYGLEEAELVWLRDYSVDPADRASFEARIREALQ